MDVCGVATLALYAETRCQRRCAGEICSCSDHWRFEWFCCFQFCSQVLWVRVVCGWFSIVCWVSNGVAQKWLAVLLLVLEGTTTYLVVSIVELQQKRRMLCFSRCVVGRTVFLSFNILLMFTFVGGYNMLNEDLLKSFHIGKHYSDIRPLYILSLIYGY